MKATFIHDFSVFENNNNFYTFGGFPHTIWERYMQHIEQLNVICRKKEPPKANLNNYQKSNKKNINIIPLENYSSFKKINKRKKELNKMAKVIKNSDFIILRLPSIVGVDSYNIIKKYKKPFIVEIVGNGYDAFYHQGSVIGKIMAPFIHKKMKEIVKDANSAIYVTENYLQNIYPNKNENIGISNAEIIFKRDIEFPIHLEKCFIEKSNLKVGFMGSLNVKYKNFYRGLEFLQKYAEDNDIKIDLSIAGEGEDKELDRLASSSKNVHLIKMGRLESREKVDKWFKSLDIFIHPSITEGLPRVILESMNNCIPVIASNAGGTSEILKSEYIFNPKEYESFRITLENLLYTPVDEVINDNYLRLGKYNKEYLNKKRSDFIKNFIKREIVN